MSTNSNHLTAISNAHDRKMSKEETERFAKLALIFESVKNNTCGTSIDISGKQIDYAGAIALANALKTNQTLANIDLECNHIGTAGAAALAEALKTNKTLTSINL